jgi:uncharacterized protein YndB with AHSA1/START domain
MTETTDPPQRTGSTGTIKPTDTSLRVQRTFDAPVEEVFNAWTDPEVMRRWWRANPAWTTPVAEVDLRVGGRYRISMEDPADGSRHTVGGEYTEVTPPTRLAYSWQWEEGGQPGDQVSAVTVDFRADGPRTTVVLEHSGLGSSESRDSHGQGWDGVLEMLQAQLSDAATHAS